MNVWGRQKTSDMKIHHFVQIRKNIRDVQKPAVTSGILKYQY